MVDRPTISSVRRSSRSPDKFNFRVPSLPKLHGRGPLISTKLCEQVVLLFQWTIVLPSPFVNIFSLLPSPFVNVFSLLPSPFVNVFSLLPSPFVNVFSLLPSPFVNVFSLLPSPFVNIFSLLPSPFVNVLRF